MPKIAILALAAVIAAAVGATAFFVVLGGQSGSQVATTSQASTGTTQSTSTAVTTISSASTATAVGNGTASSAAPGLVLGLSLNATSIASGETVQVTVVENNTLPDVDNVTSASSWPLTGMSLGPCGAVNYPMGLSVFQGHYTSGNLSSATPLTLYRPGVYACPMVRADIEGYVFQPLSDEAYYAGTGCTSGQCPEIAVNTTISVGGYWTDGSGVTGSAQPVATFHTLSPGAYTVAAGDEWGRLVVLHFAVSQ